MSMPRWKRALDLLGAFVLLLATLPLLLAVSLALLLAQGPPLLFRQCRVGRDQLPFTLFKFRTMRLGDPVPLPDRPVGRDDELRVTALGRLLRRYGLDELPQLINILRGEMSLVGPRPLPVEDLERPSWRAQLTSEEAEWLQRRHTVTPGLTGLWQISSSSADDVANWIACDLAYVESCSLGADLRIVLATPLAVWRGRASHAATSSGIIE
jgi:lipopolysaccharide/colanic/teichoic acid biosynthesis glycosyltransferase